MKKKITKENLLLIGGVIIFSIIICNAFLQMHYSQNIYYLLNRGYGTYISNYLIPNIEFISTLIFFIASAVKIPYEFFIITMNLLGVILLSLSVILLYKPIIRHLNTEKIHYKFLILLVIYIFIFNPITIRYFIYPDVGIKCLGIFFIILAINNYFKESKYKYIKIIMFLIFAFFSYKNTLIMLPIFAIITILLININKIKFKNKSVILTTIILLCFCFNIINFIRIADEHIAANIVDRNIGDSINELVKNYEQRSGNTIKKFSYKYDPNTTENTPGIKNIGDLTKRAFVSSESIIEEINFYCNKNFDKNYSMLDDIYNKHFKNKDDNCFLEDQIVFEGDTMYMYVY